MNDAPTEIQYIRDATSAQMAMLRLLDAAITSFGPALEPLTRILYTVLERLATKCSEYPSPPT